MEQEDDEQQVIDEELVEEQEPLEDDDDDDDDDTHNQPVLQPQLLRPPVAQAAALAAGGEGGGGAAGEQALRVNLQPAAAALLAVAEQEAQPVGAAEAVQQEVQDARQQEQAQQLAQAQAQLSQALLQASLPTVMGPGDPRRMILTLPEHQWAWNIKQTIEAASHIDNLPDFWYAQLAIVDQHDTEAAVERALHLQEFRQQYDIRDGFEQGRGVLRNLVNDLFPGHVLSFSYHCYEGAYVVIFDLTALKMDNLSSWEKVRTWLQCAFFMCCTMNPDLEAVRRGVIILLECEGFDWTKNLDLRNFRKLWIELCSVYPMNFVQIKHFHTGVFFNLLTSMARSCFPPHVRAKMYVGATFPQRLDSIYLVPTLEEANERALERMENCLQRRFENEQTFRLTPPPSGTTTV